MRAESPKFPIEEEPQIPTMAKPLIIESAFPGWLPPKVNPHIPLDPRLISQEIIDSVRAGAGAIHVHPRDPADGALLMDPLKLKEVIDPVFDACGEVFTWNHTWVGKPMEPITYVDHTEEILHLGNGNKYCMGSVVLITGNPGARDQTLFGDEQAVKEGVPYLEERGIKPIFQIYDTHGIEWLAREIIEKGYAKWAPFMCCLHMGKHHASYIGQDPWSHLQLITSIGALRAAIPDAIIGLRAGGRNWLPITTTAIAMGVDMVGIGQEDCLWTYPHKDEIITTNSDVIRKVVAIATELGRDVASPRQIKTILGFDHHEPAQKHDRALSLNSH
ncbi:3-keto-5-aminohexanoate cleavage protein [Pusillimonas sp.]|uniref:3-keto-5-aminohexanoate cleavage protein n=1 Tax=Pusillimonas sp. TaxID=3040095 RepID=UPI0037CA3F2D